MKIQDVGKVCIVAAVVVFALAWNSGRISAGEAMPQVGQVAPDFSLPSQDGSQISLKEFRGKWVVLYFYPKDNTPGCTIEAHNFQRDIAKYEQDNAVIVGVSVDSTDSHKDFCAKQGLTFKLLADTDKKVVHQYGSLKEMMGMKIAARNTFLVDPEGKIANVWTGVSPQHHSEEVLAELTKIKASKSS
jgi:peroxiredoxin Q/BCP